MQAKSRPLSSLPYCRTKNNWVQIQVRILRQFNYLFNYFQFKVHVHPSVLVRARNIKTTPDKLQQRVGQLGGVNTSVLWNYGHNRPLGCTYSLDFHLVETVKSEWVSWNSWVLACARLNVWAVYVCHTYAGICGQLLLKLHRGHGAWSIKWWPCCWNPRSWSTLIREEEDTGLKRPKWRRV